MIVEIFHQPLSELPQWLELSPRTLTFLINQKKSQTEKQETDHYTHIEDIEETKAWLEHHFQHAKEGDL